MIPILLAAALTSPTRVADMRWHRRILLVAAPRADDPGVIGQRKALAGWDAEARDRDIAIVSVIGAQVEGASDTAPALRKHYRLPADRFVAILIGKDGGEKLRSAKPISAEVLAETIDAMPMRRAGQH